MIAWKVLLSATMLHFVSCMNPLEHSIDNMKRCDSGHCGPAEDTCDTDFFLNCGYAADHYDRLGDYKTVLSILERACKHSLFACENIGLFGRELSGIPDGIESCIACTGGDAVSHSTNRNVAQSFLVNGCSLNSQISCFELGIALMHDHPKGAADLFELVCKYNGPLVIPGPLEEVAVPDMEVPNQDTIRLNKVVFKACELAASLSSGEKSASFAEAARLVSERGDEELADWDRKQVRNDEVSQQMQEAHDRQHAQTMALLDGLQTSVNQQFGTPPQQLQATQQQISSIVETHARNPPPAPPVARYPEPSTSTQLPSTSTQLPSSQPAPRPAPSQAEIDAQCPLPKNRPYVHGYLQHAYNQCHSVAVDLFGISGRCDTESEACKQERADCLHDVEEKNRDQVQHDEASRALADIQGGWNGEQYVINDQRVLETYDDTTNCNANPKEAMREHDQREAIADQHSAIENEWQRWYNWADNEAAKCRSALRR